MSFAACPQCSKPVAKRVPVRPHLKPKQMRRIYGVRNPGGNCRESGM